MQGQTSEHGCRWQPTAGGRAQAVMVVEKPICFGAQTQTAMAARGREPPKGRLSALRTHTKAPHKTDSLWRGLRKAKAA